MKATASLIIPRPLSWIRSVVLTPRLSGRLASGGLAIALLALTGFSVWAAMTTQRAANQATRSSLLSDAYEQARHAVGAQDSLARKYRLEQGAGVRAAHRDAAVTMITALLLARQFGEPDDQASVEGVLTAHRRYLEATQLMFIAVDAGDTARVDQLDNDFIAPAFSEIEEHVETAAEVHRQAALRTLAELSSTNDLVATATPVVFTVGLVFLVACRRVLRTYQRSLDGARLRELEQVKREAETEAEQRALQRSEERFRALVQNASDSIAILDADGTIRYESPVVHRLWGYEAGSRVGRSAFDFIAADDRSAARELFTQSLSRHGENVAGEVQIAQPDGGVRSCELVITNLLDLPAVEGVVATYRDITTRKALLEQLGRVEAEREADRLKSEFVSVVSHELRTPLVSLVGFSELLLTQDVSVEERREWSEAMHSEALRLTHLVEDLLDVARIEDGRLDVSSAPTPLHSAVERSLTTLRVQSGEHNLEVRLADDLPPVLADPDKLVQIVTNLVSNAIKYSPDGEPVVIAADRANGSVHLSVSDRGLGIPVDHLPRLFSKFHRIQDNDRSEIGGTGLGLYITKQLVELQGGRIWAESAGRKQGSTFHVELRAAPSRANHG